MKNFISQINMFEARLSKLGVGPKSNDWNGMLSRLNLDISGNDPDEMMMRNTYLNGIQGKNNFDNRTERTIFGSGRKVNWNDVNTGKKEGLIYSPFHIDLFIQKEVKPVTSHKKLRPSKPIIKGRSSSVDVRRSNNLNNNNLIQQKTNYTNNNNNNNNNFNPMYANNDINTDKTTTNSSNRINNFISNNHVNPPPRSFSLDQKGDSRKNNLLTNFQEKELATNIQIITPNVNSIINNNYNNIYIQSPSEMDFKKLNQIYSPEGQSKQNNSLNSNNSGINPITNNRLASAGRKDETPMSNPNTNNNFNYNAKNNFIGTNLSGNQVKTDIQKLQNNNLINSYDPKQIKVIDYSNNNNYVPQPKNSKIKVLIIVTNFNSYNAFNNSNIQQKPSSNSTNISTEKPKVIKIYYRSLLF